MDKWIWTVKHYFTPKAPIRTPLQEQWIFFHHGQKETKKDKKTTFYPQEKLKENNSEQQ